MQRTTFGQAWNDAVPEAMYFLDITSYTDAPDGGSNRWFGQQWKSTDGGWGWQVAWTFGTGIYKRYLKPINNTLAWSPWMTSDNVKIDSMSGEAGNIVKIDASAINNNRTPILVVHSSQGGSSIINSLIPGLEPGTEWELRSVF